MAEDHADEIPLETPKYSSDNMDKMIQEKTPVDTLKLPFSGPDYVAIQEFCGNVEFIIQTVNNYERVAVLDLVTYPAELKLEPHLVPPEKPVALRLPHKQLNIWLGMFAGLKCAVVQTNMGCYCAGEIKQALKQCPKARVILAIGVAYALNPDKVKLGDVLCSNSILAYSGNIKVVNGEIFPRDGALHSYTMPQQLSNVFKQEADWHALEKFTCAELVGGDTRKSKAHVGSMISWEALVRDQKVRNEIQKSFTHKETIGGEMEGVQLLLIREEAAKRGRQIDVVIIKGAADFADENKDKSWQLTAAMAAASYTKYSLDKRPGRKLLIEEDPDGGVPHDIDVPLDKRVQLDNPPRANVYNVLKNHQARLIGLISHPLKLANELVAKNLLSPTTQDNVGTTGRSRYDGASEIFSEIARYFEQHKDDQKNFLVLCQVLKNYGQPGLDKLAEEMENSVI